MALRKLSANLAERPRPDIQNIQTFSMTDAYSKYQGIDYKTSKGYAPIDTSDKTLQTIYENYKKDVVSPMYRPIGKRYSQPYLASHALEDTERITRYLATPKGGIFIIKQSGLQASQPKSHFVNLQQTRLFNPAQFLSNVPGAAIGSHFPRHGVMGLSKNYEQVTDTANSPLNWSTSHTGNRLITVYRELGINGSIADVVPETKVDKFLDKIRGGVAKVKKILGVNYSGRIIKEYSGVGGPKSLFGVGYTDIRSYSVGIPVSDANSYDIISTYSKEYEDSDYSQLSGLKILLYGGDKKQVSLTGQPGNFSATKTNGFSLGNLFTGPELIKYNSYQDIEQMANKNHFNTKDGAYPSIRSNHYNDFRKTNKVNYTDENIHKRTGIPNTGDIDPIYANEANNDQNDLIAFKFTYAGEDTPLQFRATIMALSNTFSPEWNSVDYVGRPDSVYTYKGVKRSTTFSFIVAANSEKEMDTIYIKLNKLAGMTMPSYENNGSPSNHMIGPIVTLKLGNYINNEPGYISSLDFNIEDEFIWDVDREEPMYIRVNLNFDIIGRQTPRRNVMYFGRVAK